MLRLRPNRKSVLIALAVIIIFANVALFRLLYVLRFSRRRTTPRRPKPSSQHPTHLLIVLGSGGHTAEMINMLGRLPHLSSQYTHRTYIVSSGDGFSAAKAAEFEEQLARDSSSQNRPRNIKDYDIVTIPRARRVHQSLLTTPWTAIKCIWACFRVLQGTHTDQSAGSISYPDLILSNGPGTAVCVVLASIVLRFLGLGGKEQMKTIFIESWARVKTISLSGKILLPLVDRFLVQWPQLDGKGGRAEFLGALIE